MAPLGSLCRNLRTTVSLTAVLILAGCASSAEREAETRREKQQAETVAEILATPLDQEEYGAPRRCISSRAYNSFQPLGDRYLLFEGLGDKLWLNEVRGHCPQLEHAHNLAFRQRGMQLCELDQFKIVDWFAWSRYQRWPWDWMEGIPCTLGRFQPVSEEQVESLRAALDED